MGVKPKEENSEIFPVKRPFTLLTPANLVEVKGHRYLIEAVGILVKEMNLRDIRCLIAGEGVLEKKLRDMVRKMGLSEWVHFLGRIPNEDLLSMYVRREVDLVVLPSIKSKKDEEGIPVALMEAMAYGIPVISTRVGGIPELISGEAQELGLLVEPASSAALAEAIKKLHSNPSIRIRAGEVCKSIVERDFNLERIANMLIELMER
jgi:glycosyltransferase involved in cell wall biosynthesis